MIDGTNIGGGPDPQMLRSLKRMLPEAARHFSSNHHKAKQQAAQPRKACLICCKAYDLITPKIIVENPQLIPSTCPECQKSLDDGYVALITSDRYAFIKSPQLEDMAGKMLQVEKRTMDEVAKKHKTESRDNNANPS